MIKCLHKNVSLSNIVKLVYRFISSRWKEYYVYLVLQILVAIFIC